MMENLLTINKTTCKEDMLDLDDFLHQRLAPLVQKVKFQLIHMEGSKRIQEYTRNKIQRATTLLETIDDHRQLQLENITQQYKQHLLDQYEQAFTELSEKYRQLEQLQGDYLADYNLLLDDTVDSLMASIEQLDNCIGDTLDKASEMRHRVHEKFNDFADLAHEQMDHLKAAITSGAKRLLHYEELPVPWRNNMVKRMT
jgi:adiponectin receptor